MLSVAWVSQIWLWHSLELLNQNHCFQVSGHHTIVLMCGNYPPPTCLWSLRINHVDWLFPYCSVLGIVFPCVFFCCPFLWIWLSMGIFPLLRPPKPICSKQKTQWFLRWFLTSRTCTFLQWSSHQNNLGFPSGNLGFHHDFPMIIPAKIIQHPGFPPGARGPRPCLLACRRWHRGRDCTAPSSRRAPLECLGGAARWVGKKKAGYEGKMCTYMVCIYTCIIYIYIFIFIDVICYMCVYIVYTYIYI